MGKPPADARHFDPKGKAPSTFTLQVRKGQVARLPFADKRDFEEARRGFIAEPPYKKIMADAGNVAWDMGSYAWLLQDKDFATINPSLQRQAVLNMAYGLYEVVFAGNAMSRRLQWQYAVLLPRDPTGHVDQAIGKNIANGSTGLIAPNRIIAEDFEEITLDGERMVFHNTPDTEAPVEMNTFFPQFKAFWAAENVTGTIHNIYTLRGAAVRNALNWSKEINVALWKFGQEAEVMFASHTWPRWGNARIQEVMRAQRDAYANLNNQALHYANRGVTINQIHNVCAIPKSLEQQWAARSYHGDLKNNTRAVINRFLGFYDGNPVNLHPLSPEDSAPLYVEMMGGSARIIAKAGELTGLGRYLEATEILNKLCLAEPRNQPARELLADVYEQLGYQAESTSARNSYLQGAFELRNGLPGGVPPRSAGPDVVRSMTTEMWLDFLGISLDPKRAEGLSFTLNLVTPDNGEKYLVELSNATLTNIEGRQAVNPDLTITLNRSDLNRVMMGVSSFDDLIREGKATFVGNRKPFDQFRGLLVPFTPDFEVLPGTAPLPVEKTAQAAESPGVMPPDAGE